MARLRFGRGDFKEPGYLRRNPMAQSDAVERETGGGTSGGLHSLHDFMHPRTGARS